MATILYYFYLIINVFTSNFDTNFSWVHFFYFFLFICNYRHEVISPFSPITIKRDSVFLFFFVFFLLLLLLLLVCWCCLLGSKAQIGIFSLVGSSTWLCVFCCSSVRRSSYCNVQLKLLWKEEFTLIRTQTSSGQ